MLKDSDLRNSKPGTTLKDCPIRGVAGLRFYHYASGRKSFLLYYRLLNGQEKRPKIGEYGHTKDKLTFAAARIKAAQYKKDVQAGLDPTAAKRERIAAKSFRDLAHDYIELYAKVNKKTWIKDQQMIARDLLPAFKNMLLMDIKRADIATVINVVRKRSPVMANRTFEVTRKMINRTWEKRLRN